MGVEDTPKPTISDEKIPNDDDVNAAEGGEVAGDNDTASTAIVRHPTHPLENSWTFWFDNPSGKSKQAAWGSSIRPIYTFSTIEEFWRFNFFFYFIVSFLYSFCLDSEEMIDRYLGIALPFPTLLLNEFEHFEVSNYANQKIG